MNYAVYKIDSGEIVNIVLWDGESEWTPPTGTNVVGFQTGFDIGDLYINGQFVKVGIATT
jgi:hypothetical protein